MYATEIVNLGKKNLAFVRLSEKLTYPPPSRDVPSVGNRSNHALVVPTHDIRAVVAVAHYNNNNNIIYYRAFFVFEGQ